MHALSVYVWKKFHHSVILKGCPNYDEGCVIDVNLKLKTAYLLTYLYSRYTHSARTRTTAVERGVVVDVESSNGVSEGD